MHDISGMCWQVEFHGCITSSEHNYDMLHFKFHGCHFMCCNTHDMVCFALNSWLPFDIHVP